MPLTIPEPLFVDFCRFAELMLSSGDLDPTYPVLRRSYDVAGLSQEARLWRTLLYVTWYSLGSAEAVWTSFPEPTELPRSLRLPTGVERRGFRGNSYAPDHVNAVLLHAKNRAGSLTDWVTAMLDGASGKTGWRGVRNEYERISQAGPWSSFKLADLLAHVHDVPIWADSIAGATGLTAGPVSGMARLTGLSHEVCLHDVELQEELLSLVQTRVPAMKTLDELETCLCDFNSLAKGSYYVGHDIDLQMESLASSGPLLWEARAVFDSKVRGEVNGWSGLRRSRKLLYRDQGVILAPEEPAPC